MARLPPQRRIVFTGDIFRIARDQLRPNQTQNILWLWRLLRRQIEMATGVSSRAVVWPTDSTHETALAPGSVPNFLERMNLPRTVQGWAAAYDAVQLPDIVEGYLGGLFDGALVIGFELPPVLRRFLDRSGTPYIDLVVHPVRFLDDITLALATNCAAMREIARRHCLSGDYLMTMAGLQSAAAGRGYTPDIPDASLLFLGQVRDDKTQIEGGRFRGPAEFIPTLRSLAASHHGVVLKPHPLDKDNPGMLALEMAFKEAKLLDDNFYKLMSTDHVRTVASLSSSTGVEARYFGKEAAFLLAPPFRLASLGEQGPESYLDLDWSLLAPDFWRDLMAPYFDCTPPDGMSIPFKPNRLRISLNAFWRFNEIDTDLAVAAYPR
ncbi:MAG: capsular biosynthesis protein [Roseococcus sp.]|nr:capsular biosynthesis protein [Roseococcus sp.]